METDSSQYDTIICIGAGQGDQVEGWRAAGASRIILVEPNPAYRTHLSALTSAHAGVEVIPAAIADEDGTAALHVLNLARHSSLRSPAGLNDLLPGLRQIAEVTVSTLTAASLLASIGELSGNVALILDAPGSEMEVLRGFSDASALEMLAGIELICTEDPQYRGASSRAALQSFIEQAGFVLTKSDLSDPDWPQLSFRIDQHARRLVDLTVRLQEISGAAQVMQDRLMFHKAFAKSAAQDLTTLQSELESVTATCAKQKSALELAKARDADQQQEIAELREALNATQTAAAEQPPGITMPETALAAKDQTLAEADTAMATNTLALQSMASELSAAQARSAQLSALVQSSDDALADLHAALSLARAENAEKTEAAALQASRIIELEFRQRQARDELRRFEGQMDLIKDLLLRGERL